MAMSAIQSLGVRDDDLLSIVHAFNISPARYIHYSWMEKILPESQFEIIRKSYRAERVLSQRILKEINHHYIYDFEKKSRRLALLDKNALENLILLTGVALISKKIAKIIVRSKMLAIKQDLGKEVYDFALKRAPLLVDGTHLSLEEAQEEMDYRALALAYGTKCIETCFSQEPEALLKRFQFRFSQERIWDFNQEVSAEERGQAWSILKRVLLQEVAPQWKPIFS